MTIVNIDAVKNKKHTILVSAEVVPTAIQNIHTVKDPWINWSPPNSEQEELRFCLYELFTVDKIVLGFLGLDNFTTIEIQTSIDGQAYEVLSAAFIPAEKEIEIDYSSRTKDFVFLKIIINNPTGVLLTLFKFEVNINIDFDNNSIISHNYLSLYSQKEREDFPFFPSMVRTNFEMLEGLDKLDLKLFDDTLFTNSTVTAVDGGSDDYTFTPNNIPVLTNTKYIWDFDDIVLFWVTATTYAVNNRVMGRTQAGNIHTFRVQSIGSSPVSAVTEPDWPETGTVTDGDIVWVMEVANNGDVINTANPLLVQTHTYILAGTFIPKLLIFSEKFKLELTSGRITKT